MSEIKAIETEYAGCRFRSRLEARWAVFLDALGIRWHYEEEGFELPGGGRYLPDFRLENATRYGDDLWVEVKGELSHRDLIKLHRASMLRPMKGLHPKILVLGDIPRPGAAHTHPCLSVVGEHILHHEVRFVEWRGRHVVSGASDALSTTVASVESIDPGLTQRLRESWVGAVTMPYAVPVESVDDAYRAARSARFEFGERG